MLTEKDLKTLRETIGLLNSMVSCKEDHSNSSRNMVTKSISILENEPTENKVESMISDFLHGWDSPVRDPVLIRNSIDRLRKVLGKASPEKLDLTAKHTHSIPKGETAYVLNKKSGKVRKVKGPRNILLDRFHLLIHILHRAPKSPK